jgi:uncharacterized protein YbjQ (UPF0145 family)
MALELWLQIIPFLILLTLGFTVGGFVERRHLRRLVAAESELADIMVTDLKTAPPGASKAHVGLVTGEVVIASDYFKTVVAKVKGLFGGELHTFQTLMDRARREALVRMVRRAKAMGANRVYNVRFESSNIGAMRRKKAAAMVELYAYGTAFFVSDDDFSE